jgi:hypothetical protein
MTVSAHDDTFVTVQKPSNVVTKLKYFFRKVHFDHCDRTFNFLKVDL